MIIRFDVRPIHVPEIGKQGVRLLREKRVRETLLHSVSQLEPLAEVGILTRRGKVIHSGRQN